MYLSKYWRESRNAFGIALLLIAMLFVLVMYSHVTVGAPNSQDPRQISGLIVISSYMQILPLGFFAWLIGSLGVGRDLGEGSGSFLFSRPRRRAYFLWCDWGFGLSQVILITILANLVLWLLMHRLLIAMDDPLGGHVPFSGAHPTPLPEAMALSAIAAILITGLIFSVTYASTVVMRHARGVILSIGLFTGYLALGAVVHHFWETVTFPSLLFQPFDLNRHSLLGLNVPRAFEILLRCGVILLFPVAAQISLDRSEL